MSKKIAADHIKLKRAYELPAPDERTGLCFRESEVKAYGDGFEVLWLAAAPLQNAVTATRTSDR